MNRWKFSSESCERKRNSRNEKHDNRAEEYLLEALLVDLTQLRKERVNMNTGQEKLTKLRHKEERKVVNKREYSKELWDKYQAVSHTYT